MANWIVKRRILIFVLAVILLVPSVLGMMSTKVKYDLLYYLPDTLDTVKGQEILMDDFGKGAFSLFLVEGMEDKDVSALKTKIEAVPHVESVIWYDSILDVSVPKEILPDSVYSVFNNDTSTLMAIFFDDTSSAENTMEAIQEIRAISGKQCFLSGLSAIVTDTKNLVEEQEAIYVLIAVALAVVVLAISMDSLLLPLLFLVCIGMSVLYNMGTNYFLGEVSYITKAIAAVLQLGVTLDYSIFLWHSYKEQKALQPTHEEAMAKAISVTLTSIVGSSLTTIAGFVSICFMSFTLGRDLGIVMSKGVVLGVLGTVTILPALILMFDRAIEKTSHKPLMPNVSGIAGFITKHYKVIAIIFVLLLVPSFYGYRNIKVYYDMSSCLPDSLESVAANKKVEEQFDVSTTHLVLCDSKMSAKDAESMMNEMKQVDGVGTVLGLNSLLGTAMPEEMLPADVVSMLKSDKYQLMMITSEYIISSDAVNSQIDQLNAILKKYDENGMLIGEAPCTKDLIACTDNDFNVVSLISIIAIFIIIMIVLKSFSLPVVLVAVIEFAIFVNLCIPYYTNTSLPFVASILVSTIQLGATVDYAILMTTRYRQARTTGVDKTEAVRGAVASSAQSILVSGMGFFAATFGVGLYSNVDIISSMCTLISRGAVASVVVVLFVLPSLLILLDKVICKTTFDKKHTGKEVKA